MKYSKSNNTNTYQAIIDLHYISTRYSLPLSQPAF